MKRLTAEMKKVIDDLYEKVDMDCDICCDRCPYADRCAQEQLFWGCEVWEDSMGADL